MHLVYRFVIVKRTIGPLTVLQYIAWNPFQMRRNISLTSQNLQRPSIAQAKRCLALGISSDYDASSMNSSRQYYRAGSDSHSAPLLLSRFFAVAVLVHQRRVAILL